MIKNFEEQYLDKMNEILSTGSMCENRTGTDVKKKSHSYVKIENVFNNFPIIKGKPVFPHMSLTEALWFLQGRTDAEFLNTHNVFYWDEWMVNGTIGKSYGHQFRNFNGADQVLTLLDEMKNNPLSRRQIINLWNASDIKEMSLPPCVDRYKFEGTKKVTSYNGTVIFVDLHVSQRSADMFLGVPYDFMIVAWIKTIFCDYLNLPHNQDKHAYTYIPKDIHYTMNDCHIYENHFDQVKEYIGNCKTIKEDIDHKTSIVNLVPTHQEIESKVKTFDDFLKYIIDSWDGKKYTAYNIDKNWKNQFGKIYAQVAI